jgi:hypothetical protein
MADIEGEIGGAFDKAQQDRFDLVTAQVVDMGNVEDRRFDGFGALDQIVVLPDRKQSARVAGKLFGKPGLVIAKMRNPVQIFTGVEIGARHVD